jgi:hypothetical protein
MLTPRASLTLYPTRHPVACGLRQYEQLAGCYVLGFRRGVGHPAAIEAVLSSIAPATPAPKRQRLSLPKGLPPSEWSVVRGRWERLRWERLQ